MYLPGYQVKIIGRSIGGSDEPVIDGDLDNVCWESKPNEGPCPPNAIRGRPPARGGRSQQVQPAGETGERWDKQSQDRLERRRLAARRKEFRDKNRKPVKAITRNEMIRAIDDGIVSTEEFQNRFKEMFSFTMLGRQLAKSVIREVFVSGGPNSPELDENPDNLIYDTPAITMYGHLELPDGRIVGRFDRTFFPESDKVKHEELVIEPEYKGTGVGGDFIAESEQAYLKAGFDKVELTAGFQDGPFVWAAKGFDWSNEKSRNKFLDTLEMEALLEKERLASGKSLKYFSSGEDLEEILKLIKKARGQQFDDEGRVRPFDFTYSDGVRNILTDREVEKRAWQGTKRL